MLVYYVDQSDVEIIAEIGGCGYVYVSWNVTNDIELCQIVQYNVTLSSSTMSMIIPNVAVDSYNFTGLSFDTLFIVTVIGISVNGSVINSDSTSIRTETNSINCMFANAYIQYLFVFKVECVCANLCMLLAYICLVHT